MPPSLKYCGAVLVPIEDTTAMGVCLCRHLGDCANCYHHGRPHRSSGASTNESVYELGADLRWFNHCFVGRTVLSGFSNV